MTGEITNLETENRHSPESWRTYGKCSIGRRMVTLTGENPITVSSPVRSDVEAALRECRQWLAPAPRERILAWLSELYLKTVRAASSDDDFKARLEIYARELARFPADVVCDVLQRWRGNFFPTWAELADALERDRRLIVRTQIASALTEFLRSPPGAARKGNPVTADFIESTRRKYGFDRKPEHHVATEHLEYIRRVDERFGEKARASGGKWRPLAEIERMARPNE